MNTNSKSLRNPFKATLGVARVLVFALTVYAGLSVWAVYRANADVENMLLGMGEELMAFPGETEEARQLKVNGAAISLRTQVVSQPVDQVLAHYKATCAKQNAGFAPEKEIALLNAPNAAAQEAVDEAFDLTMHGRTDQAGFVTCLDLAEQAVGYKAFVARALKAVETGDLSDIGQMRYAYAKRSVDDDNKTFLLTMWTEQGINLYDMFPQGGQDVPGYDAPDVPRPEGTQRIWSAWEEGQPYAANIYNSHKLPVEALESFYHAELPAAGWRLLTTKTSPIEVDGTQVIGAQKGERVLAFLLRDDKEGPTITILTTE